MKLLIVTQVVDTEHVILGFFCRWIEEFAKHCEHVHVICLQAGRHSLPDNVTVHSLGKKNHQTAGPSLRRSEETEKVGPRVFVTLATKLRYTISFYKLIWQLRHQYDSVFVHMNQIYVILGAPLWRAVGKRIGLWYTHGAVSRSLRAAEKVTHDIFTASPEGCQMSSKKIIVTGHGIDTAHFLPDSTVDKELDLITVGRITPAKNLMQLVDILQIVRKTQSVSLTIVGAPVTATEVAYQAQLKEYVQSLGLTEHVHFIGRVSQSALPAVLNRSKVFVTVAQNGSLDKAILEPMACGLPVVSMAPGTVSLPLGDNQVTTTDLFCERISDILSSKVWAKPDYVSYIISEHSLKKLITRLLKRHES